uniref:Uncharacterized protein n=1 Tax=Timema poppense TaxID=170557 RepID=A0A7R9CT45_TIMPO|nr:unnamed protein product [Timema poppensis]
MMRLKKMQHIINSFWDKVRDTKVPEASEILTDLGACPMRVGDVTRNDYISDAGSPLSGMEVSSRPSNSLRSFLFVLTKLNLTSFQTHCPADKFWMRRGMIMRLLDLHQETLTNRPHSTTKHRPRPLRRPRLATTTGNQSARPASLHCVCVHTAS